MPTPETRPPLTERLSADEFRRWYWLRTELGVLASSLGLGAGGAETELADRADRIAAHLAGPSVPARVRARPVDRRGRA